MDMGVFEPPCFTASASISPDECTASLVTPPHLAADVRRNGSATPRRLALRRSRPLRRGRLLRQRLLEQRAQRPLHDLGRVAVRSLMREQVLKLPELAMGLLVEGHLE